MVLGEGGQQSQIPPKKHTVCKKTHGGMESVPGLAHVEEEAPSCTAMPPLRSQHGCKRSNLKTLWRDEHEGCIHLKGHNMILNETKYTSADMQAAVIPHHTHCTINFKKKNASSPLLQRRTVAGAVAWLPLVATADLLRRVHAPSTTAGHAKPHPCSHWALL